MSYIYAGLAGDTSPGIEWVEKHMGLKMTVRSGLFRRPFGEGNWEPITSGLPDRPEIRAITVHPSNSDTVYVATQDGPYRTNDHGDHWERGRCSQPRPSHVVAVIPPEGPQCNVCGL